MDHLVTPHGGELVDLIVKDDPYEAPENPEVDIDTTDITPDEAAQEVLIELQREGYIK